MNLLIESNDELSCLIVEGTENTPKNYFIEGNFIQTNIKNRNGRVYPKPIMERVLNNFQVAINEKRATGELGHPNIPTTTPANISHLIEKLTFNGDNVSGRARLLDTPMGKIAKALVNEGVKLGVSTRGLGTVKESIVQNDFNLISIDIVADPSGPDCWVTGLMENKEWVFENGLLIEKDINQIKEDINNTYKYNLTPLEREQKILNLFNKYIKQL